MNANLYHLLYSRFAGQLDARCLVLADGQSWAYGELHRLSGQLAGVLLRRAAAGDRVLMQVGKSPAAVVLYLACLRAGLVLVPLNTAYTRAELDYFRADAAPAIEVYDTSLQALLEAARAAPPSSAIAAVRSTDLAAILYTSGTTGRSKGAMLSHGNLASNALTLHRLWGFVSGDVLLHALPLFHVHGLFVALHCALLNASPILFLEKFDTAAVLAQLPAASVMMGVPTFYTRLLAAADFGPQHSAHMRLFISGSAPLTEATFAEFEARTGHRILERYGLSEAGMITSNPLQGARIAGTVGYALPAVEVRVCDARGSPLPAGAVGVVEARGPNIFAGYWQMPGQTAEALREDGFLITGDLGTLAVDGRLRLVGRSKDLIISGGLNVYPREVEMVLDELPGIAESAVVGVAHPDFGEAVLAICVPVADNLPAEELLLSQLQERLARFKQPRRIIQFDALPRNAMGKVQKNKLREQYRELFLT